MKLMALLFQMVLAISYVAGAASNSVRPKAIKLGSAPAQEIYQADIGSSRLPLEVEGAEHTILENHLEISASAWRASHFERPTTATYAGEFSPGIVPSLSVQVLSSWSKFDQHAIESIFGAGYSELSRQGAIANGTGESPSTQTVRLANLRMGASWRYTGWWKGRIQPGAQLIGLPTWISSSKSLLESSTLSGSGFYYETSVQVFFCPDFMRSQHSSQGSAEGFGVGSRWTMGSVLGSDLSGQGNEFIFRMGI